jgi:hypothetical protein
MASLHRLIDDVVMGRRKRQDKSSAMCRRLTPHTTAREQAQRVMRWLICCAVETPWIAGVKYLRWCWSSREDPWAKMNRY